MLVCSHGSEEILHQCFDIGEGNNSTRSDCIHPRSILSYADMSEPAALIGLYLKGWLDIESIWG